MGADVAKIFQPELGMQRSHGRAHARFGCARGRVGLRDLRQEGSAKVLLPRPDTDVPEVVFLNTSGGLTAGDQLAFSLTLGAGCRVVSTTQTAERAYDAGRGLPARVQVSHQVGAGGWLDWLPQETILFQGAALQRHSEINLAKDAGCLLLEAVVLGRAAMGETVTRLQFHDRRIIRRQGRVMWIEPLRLDDAVLAGSDRPALLAGARALASLVMVGPNLGDVLGPLRAVLDEPGVQAAASVFEGRLVVRLLAADGWPLRRQILRVLALLRQAPPPRVWQM